LGGLAGADAKCQDRATAAGLSGTFKAWLSAAGTGNSAAERLTHATVRYVRVDGAQVAANWTDLVDTALTASISIDEFGNPFTGSNAAWTGTHGDGSNAPSNCNSWLSSTGLDSGHFGAVPATNGQWTGNGTSACSIVFHLYCVEQ
jgi:hypothetical protein